ncbi:hypothetical protein NDU88_006434 [Pleurodeles waltl]|uniref:Uncharacterized protein n=1 Tax=Pleurodeles waltl TaxID=8319 RepID=A0AAV7MZ77_PLEWA|nr:hypothetical protein NDU88_006434 [Pleurodeles waltl]
MAVPLTLTPGGRAKLLADLTGRWTGAEELGSGCVALLAVPLTLELRTVALSSGWRRKRIDWSSRAVALSSGWRRKGSRVSRDDVVRLVFPRRGCCRSPAGVD